MKSKLLDVGEIVYNYKFNYIRIYTGGSLSEWIDYKFNDTNDVNKYFTPLLIAINKGIKVVLDSSAEAETVKQSLIESNKLYKFDLLYDWLKKNNIPNDLFEIWTSDFLSKINNGKYGEYFKTINQYKNNVAYALDNQFLDKRKFDRKFICAMSRNTIERYELFKLFEYDDSLKNNTYYSFNFREDGNYVNKDIDLNLPHLSLERYDDMPNQTSRTEFAGFELQNKTAINITCETHFFQKSPSGEKSLEEFFTEKTFRPLAMCQPFIYVAKPNMLEKLKSYGFKTFDKWWDESYDSIDDDWIRLNTIKDLITQLNKKSLNELTDMYIDMIDVLYHNYLNLFKLEENYYEFHINHNYNEIGKNEAYYHYYFKIFK